MALEAHIGWRPGDGEYHLFAIDITEVGYFAVVGEDHDVRTWVPTRDSGLTRAWHLSGPTWSCHNACTMRTGPINPSITLVLVS